MSKDPRRVGRNGWAFGPVSRVRTESSQRARRSESGLELMREDLSTTLRAKGERAEGSSERSWTRRTVPMAPFPSTLMALRLSSSISSILLEREREIFREREEGSGGKCGVEVLAFGFYTFFFAR